MLNVIGLFEVKLKAVMLSVEGPFLSIGPNEMICFWVFVLSKYLLPNATAYPSISARDKVVINCRKSPASCKKNTIGQCSEQILVIASPSGMGKISKQRHLNEKIRYGAVQYLSFYEARWILKFLFQHHLMNEIKIFKNFLKWAWTIFLVSSQLRLTF